MTDDYIATMVLVISFKVLGLAPYAMKKNPESKPSTNTTPRDHGRIKFSISRLGSFYNIVLLAVHLRLLTLGMHTVYSDQYPGKSTVTETIELLVTLFGNSVLTMIYLMLAIRQRAAVRVLNRLLSLHDGISDRNDKYTCESCRNYFLLVSLANLVVLIGIQTMGWLGFEYSFIGMVRIDWPIAIISWFMTQYIFVVKFMYHPLKYVNRRLADCSAATLSVNARRLFVVRDAPLNESLVESVTGLRRVHDELYQIATEVSDFYSFPMLLSITHLVTVVVYSAYYLILPFVVMSDTQTTLMIIHSVVYMICTFLPIAVLTLEITRFTTEMKRTVDIVDKLLVFSDIDEHGRIELREFALVLMHRKIRFTASGLFLLDLTLVHSILSMATTYIIILIQNQMARGSKTTGQLKNSSTLLKSNPTGYNGI